MQTKREELKQKILKAEAEAGAQRAKDPYRFGFHLMPPFVSVLHRQCQASRQL